MNSFKIGLVGCSQLSFPGDKKSVFEKTSKEVEKLSKLWNFDLYVYPHQVITPEDGYAAVKTLEEEKIDFLLLQCTSFSAGTLAPIFARMKNTRLGLWAIPESAKDGIVSFNSLCGINLYSSIIGHYLNNYKIPVKWFYGNVDDPLFKDRLLVTVRALKAIKKLKQSSVALIGGLAPGFDDLYDDERNLIHLFDGLRINRLHEYDEIKKIAMAYPEEAVKKRMEEETAWGKGFLHATANKMMNINARFAMAYEDFVKEKGYDAIAVSCWPKFQEDYMYSVCAAIGELNDKGIVAACEGDLTSAISMLLLKYVAEDTPVLMDMSDFDQKDDTILMWHCGPASKRFCEKKGFSYGLNYSGSAHDPDEKEISGTGVVRDMEFDPGKITIARLAGESDKIFLATGEIIDSQKPSFHGSRGWIGNIKIGREPVTALDFLNTVLVRHMQHHFPIVYGDYTDEMMEIMSWLGLKNIEKVSYEACLQSCY